MSSVGGRRLLRDEVVLCGVHGDPVQPRIELRIATEVAQRPVRAQEGFLRDVLALAPVGDVAADQADDPMLVLAHQQVERRTVAALHAPDQLLVELSCWDNSASAMPRRHSCMSARPKPGNGTTLGSPESSRMCLMGPH